MTEEYDPQTCIDAGQLRAMGLAVPADIPDCGWIPRRAMSAEMKSMSADGNSIMMDMAITFAEPFRWVNLTVMVTP